MGALISGRGEGRMGEGKIEYSFPLPSFNPGQRQEARERAIDRDVTAFLPRSQHLQQPTERGGKFVA